MTSNTPRMKTTDTTLKQILTRRIYPVTVLPPRRRHLPWMTGAFRNDVGDEGASQESIFRMQSTTKSLRLKDQQWEMPWTAPGAVPFGGMTAVRSPLVRRLYILSNGKILRRKCAIQSK